MTEMNTSVPMLQAIWDLKNKGKTLENIHSQPIITVRIVSVMTENIQDAVTSQYAFTSYRHVIDC